MSYLTHNYTSLWTDESFQAMNCIDNQEEKHNKITLELEKHTKTQH